MFYRRQNILAYCHSVLLPFNMWLCGVIVLRRTSVS